MKKNLVIHGTLITTQSLSQYTLLSLWPPRVDCGVWRRPPHCCGCPFPLWLRFTNLFWFWPLSDCLLCYCHNQRCFECLCIGPLNIFFLWGIVHSNSFWREINYLCKKKSSHEKVQNLAINERKSNWLWATACQLSRKNQQWQTLNWGMRWRNRYIADVSVD